MIASASGGVEPLFGLVFSRLIMDGTEMLEVNPIFKDYMTSQGLYSEELMQKIAKDGSVAHVDGIPEDVKKIFVTAHDVTPYWHVKMQAAFQLHTDNAVSKTVNFVESATREDIEEAAKVFIGVIEQIPPRYAAIKVDGRKLYEYARAGQEVDVKSRKIEIASFDVLDFGKRYVEEVQADLFYTVVKVVCSKGTYIRSLARDLGNILGAGGAMSALVRRRSGALKIEDAISVETIRNMEIGEIEGFIKGAEEVLTGFPAVMLGEWESRLFRNGVKREASQWHNENAGSELYKVFGSDGFIGVGREYDDGTLKADKVLA